LTQTDPILPLFSHWTMAKTMAVRCLDCVYFIEVMGFDGRITMAKTMAEGG